jgi:hypothetical protein
MSLSPTSIDRTTLPWSLLPLAKAHMRVTFDDDDQIIVFKLQHAIDLFERLTQFSVFKATYQWGPTLATGVEGLEANTLGALVPLNRASSFTAKDEHAVDITAQYLLTGASGLDPISPQYLTTVVGGVSPSVTLTAGYAYPSEMPPSLIDIVLRIASYLYEWREVQNVPGVDNVAYANSLLSGFWVPRC